MLIPLSAALAITVQPVCSTAVVGGECEEAVFSVYLEAGVEGPRLRTPEGVPVIGQSFSLQITDGPPFAPAILVLGLEVIPLPWPDPVATWHVAPPFDVVPLLLDASGTSPELSTPGFDANTCGLPLVAQAIAAEGGGESLRLSNAVLVRPGHPTPVVFKATVVPIGGPGRDAVVADFDGDGHLDMAVAQSGGAGVSVVLGDGKGVFRPAPSTGTSSPNACAIVAGHFGGDGILDLAVLYDTVFGEVAVFAGEGDGTFQVASTYNAGVNPVGLVAADFNGDGRLDLAAASRFSEDLTLLFGIGNHLFAGVPKIPLGAAPGLIDSGDFDEDGHVDLIVTMPGEILRLLLGDGTGSFAQTDLPAQFSGITGMTVDDLNADELDDLVLTGSFDSRVAAFLGSGAASFAQSALTFSPSGPVAPVVADFNGDGYADVAVTHDDGADLPNHSITVLPGLGDGTFGVALDYDGREDGHALVVGDWNEDGLLDVGVASGLDEVELAFGLGDGTFPTDAPDLEGAGSLSVIDVNADDFPDLVTLEGDELRVYLTGEGGSFEQVHLAPLGDSPGHGIAGDWNEDGLPDYATASIFFAGVEVVPGYGDGTFGTSDDAIFFATDDGSWTMASGDLDGNGDPELIVANKYVDSFSVLSALPGLDFHPAVHYPAVGYQGISLEPPEPIVGDVSGDGVLDVLVGDGEDEMNLMLGVGDGTLIAGPALSPREEMTPRALADVNLDGQLDLIACSHSAVHVFEGLGAGVFGGQHVAKSEAGTTDVDAGDVDNDGNIDLVATSLRKLVVLRGLGGFDFDHPISHASWFASRAVLADLDLDGSLDAVDSSLTVFLNLSGEP